MSCKRYSMEAELKISESNKCKFQCCKAWSDGMDACCFFRLSRWHVSAVQRTEAPSIVSRDSQSSPTCCVNFLYSDIGYGKDTKHFVHPLGFVSKLPLAPQSDVLPFHKPPRHDTLSASVPPGTGAGHNFRLRVFFRQSYVSIQP